MLLYIYIPTDILQRCKRQNNTCRHYSLVGFFFRDCYVVVDGFSKFEWSKLKEVDPLLRVVGHIYLESEVPTSTETNAINFRIDEKTQQVYVDDQMYSKDKFSVVSYSPPNIRNLEYFTVKPIFLQSTGKGHHDHSLIDKMELSHQTNEERPHSELCSHSEAVLDKINQCQKIRSMMTSEHVILPQYQSFFKRNLSYMAYSWYSICVAAIGNAIMILTKVIQILNNNVYGFVPIKSSAWCKQLDIRLRQLTYFPIQFMCYYDPEAVSENLRNEIDSSPVNKRLNINNSNYINLYNSVWLIFNDVLLGRVCYTLFIRNKKLVLKFLNDMVLKALLFAKLEELIKWVGLYHPAGFKLNNDMGSFMQSIFIWTSQLWTGFFDLFVNLMTTESLFNTVCSRWFRITCYCGFSFVIAALIDYLKFFNLHIYFFNIATTKIYNRQVEMLKSLMQLFRGKKYNILRNRVDSIEESQFCIDQLLLGTFCFMFLLYLLPTTFAFYILFFLARITILTFSKLGEKVILSFNLYPLFVVLLKLKNSKRLQGGVTYKYLRTCGNSDCFVMENKALTFDQIYGNFYKVFRQEGQYVRLLMNLLEGKELELRDTTLMKKNYLMLPRNYQCLRRVWVAINPRADLTILGDQT